eukprot:3290362-Pleurochrysis_carterae.AAC.4
MDHGLSGHVEPALIAASLGVLRLRRQPPAPRHCRASLLPVSRSKLSGSAPCLHAVLSFACVTIPVPWQYLGQLKQRPLLYVLHPYAS